MIDTKLNEDITLSRYVKCEYHDGTTIIVGHIDKGKHVLSIEKQINNKPKVITRMALPEDNMTGLLAAMLLYAERYDIDLSARIKELLAANNVFYYCKEKE